jgi:hypothetical protein
MTTTPTPSSPGTGKTPILPGQKPPAQKSLRPTLLHLPGLFAISGYLLLLAGITIYDVASGLAQPVHLIFPVFFIASACGLLMRLRWAWALAITAMAMLAAFFMWEYSTQHLYPFLVQGLLNLFFFLYLVRTEVRENLK